MAAAAKPRSTSSSATLAAVRLVRLKMMVRPRPLGLQHPGEHLDLVHRVRAVDELLDGLDGVGVLVVVAHGADVRGLAHVAAGQRHDGAGHRRREEHRLARGGRQGDRLDVGQEAEVEHLVGFVEHDGGACDRSRSRCLARSMSRPGVPTTISTPFFSASICPS